MLTYRNLRLLPLLLALACGDTDPSPDQDAGSSDAGSSDAGNAEQDAAIDEDAGLSADAGAADAGADAGTTDAGADAGTDDAGVPSCDPGEYVGSDGWTDRLVVPAGAALCAYAADMMDFNPGRLADVIRLKGTFEPVPGTYAVPSASAEAAFRIPVCLHDADGSVALGTTDSLRVAREGGIGSPDGIYITANFAAGDDELTLRLFKEPDAREFRFANGPSTFYGVHQEGPTASRGFGENERYYAACDLPANTCHRLRGEGVDLRIEENTWSGSPGRGFAAGQRLVGTFDGEDIDITGYENISTYYNRHAFGRSHFFAFDAPTPEGHCGLRIDLGEPGAAADFIAYADCTGAPMGDRIAYRAERLECPAD